MNSLLPRINGRFQDTGEQQRVDLTDEELQSLGKSFKLCIPT
jgi:hypothetical protein